MHEAFHEINVIGFHVKSSLINEEHQGHDLFKVEVPKVVVDSPKRGRGELGL